MARTDLATRDPFAIHEDPENDLATKPVDNEFDEDDEAENMSEYSSEEDDTDEEVDESVIEDMKKLESTFKGISERFRLINRIGEGTFSTVYKAEDLHYHRYNNDWNKNGEYDASPRKRRRLQDARDLENAMTAPRRAPLVAIKKIYVTSSPMRIANELELLHDLRASSYICPLITAFRHHDQVVAVLPYFPHQDFRLYYRDFTVSQMRYYFRALFSALHAVHKHNILHRDVKPTNFLYNPSRRHGVLVDFGLAEREVIETPSCICRSRSTPLLSSTLTSPRPQSHTHQHSSGYPKNDSRPARRANRAGTRGFRAPEVLLKCTSQTTRIDIWSSGVILLTLLAKRFPFFNSADDIDATIEMATIFGSKKMKACARLHGLEWESTIPTVGENGHSLDKLIRWSTCRTKEDENVPGEELAIDFLEACLRLDPRERLSAKQCLQHEFLQDFDDEDEEGYENAEEHHVNENIEEGGYDRTMDAQEEEGDFDEMEMIATE